MVIHKLVTIVEEQRSEGGQPLSRPLTKVAAAAVIANPLAGSAGADLTPLIEAGGTLGRVLAERILSVLPASSIESFGKGAVVGTDGELEHAAALIHPEFGVSVRKVLGGGRAIIPSTKKVGGPGTAIDVPVVYKEAMRVASHFDALEVRVPDAPRPGDVLVVLVCTDGGRPHARIPGLRREDAKGVDGVN
jgi:hypothetical protein